MNLPQLQSLVDVGESELLEFKRSTGSLREAAATICAFLNGRGGQIFFGVADDASIVGQQVGNNTIDDIARELQEIEPPACPAIEQVPIGSDKAVIVVSIQQGQNRPYTHRRRAYKRIGNTTYELTKTEYDQMLLEHLHGQRRWENEPADGWAIEDLDAVEVVRTVEESIRRGRSEDPGTRDIKTLIQGLGLSRNGSPLRAAAMLFGRDRSLERDFPQCLLRAARFRGVSRSEFIDGRQFYGNAFSLLRRADRFMREHLPVAGRIVPNLFERVDDPLYPPAALREALANAICHRDYTIGGGSIAVAIYDDRLEITSSGTLHFGLTADALYYPHDSLPWNPLIARVLYRHGIIEQWGRGTLNIVELTQRAGLPRPEIEQAGGCVTVRFLRADYIPPERIPHTLTSRQRQILQVLQRSGGLPLRELRAALGNKEPVWAIKEDLALLKGLGKIATAGHGRGAYWYLTERQ